ncbi:hypothetical protein M5K25_011297 [Dendrobium thyrsiflorum]|uniref:Uncharacterized protein n=1 Tax=Dendrobium thyrsiflorum TaxID=117978 RepID=A0ABD0V2D1_DENTH
MKKGIATTDEQVDSSMTQNKKSDEEFNSKAVIENTLISKDVREEIHNEVPNSVASKGNEIAEKDFGNPDEVLQTKLRRSLRNLFFWSKYKLKELNKDILNLQEDECSEEGLSSNKLLILRWKLHELNIILARIASWWKQRAKSKWLEEARMNGNRINQVRNNYGKLQKWRSRNCKLDGWPDFLREHQINEFMKKLLLEDFTMEDLEYALKHS